MKLDLAEYFPRNTAGQSATRHPFWRHRRPLVWGVGALLLALFLLVAFLPTFMSAWYLASGARLLDAGGDVAQAARSFERAREWSPSDSEVERALARAYMRLAQPQAAIGALERVYRHQPESLLIRQELAQAYEAAGQGQRADALWLSLGMSGTAMLELGEQARAAGRLDEALRWYERAGRVLPKLPSNAWYLRAMAWQAQGLNEQAFDALGRAIGADEGWLDAPMRFKAWALWGNGLFERQRYAEAEAALRMAIDAAPSAETPQTELSELYRFLGLAQWNQDQLAPALPNLARAVELNVRSPWAHIHYGKALYLLNQRDAAAAELEAGLSLAADNPEAWKSVIDFWHWQHQAERVDALCRRARSQAIASAQLPRCLT